MRTKLTAILMALVATAAAATPARAAGDFTKAKAIAIVQGIVNEGRECAAPAWGVSGYKAEPFGDGWTVHAYLRNSKVPNRLDVRFDLESPTSIEPGSLLAEEFIKCSGFSSEAPKPQVRAFIKKGVVEPGEDTSLEFAVRDKSGVARVHLNVYQGGEWMQRWTKKVKATSLDKRYKASLELDDDAVGPLFFCVWAENAKGGKSKGNPRSSCARMALLTDIKKVSNGCGGAGWASVVAVQNYFGNTSTYTDPGTGASYTVDFRAACNLHDAGYGGQTVRDTLHGDKLVNYQSWTRAQVDEKFRTDMALLCERAIPAEAAAARAECAGNIRFQLVRDYGASFFDADITKKGTQTEGPRA